MKTYKLAPFFVILLLTLRSSFAQTPPQYQVLDLGTLGGTGSGATALNNAGQVVGYSTFAGGGENHAFIYFGGSMIDPGTFWPNGSANTTATGINNSGQVVGHSANTDNTTEHAFLYSNNTMSDLGTLGGTTSDAFGINDSGQTVGISDTSGDAASHAFFYSNGSMTDLGTLPGGTQSFAYSINKSAQIAGWSNPGGGSAHAFVYSNSSMTDLGTLGGSASVGYAINDSGHVAGYSHISGDSALHAFLYSDGTMTDLGVLDPSINYSYGHALNNSDQVVGYSNTSQGHRAFLYSAGTMYDLNNLCEGSDFAIFDASGINDLGQIAATGNRSGQNAHALLLRPITSASTNETVSSPVQADSSYVAVAPVTNSDSTNDTTASLIGGNATGDTTVNLTFVDSTSLPDFQAASDAVDFSGTGSDVVVLQLSYNEAEAINTFGSEANARLVWLDPNDNTWKLAISGNTGGNPQFFARAYDPGTDFHLGYYGVDTVHNVVWAVINHNSVFSTGNSAAVTPPTAADLRVTVTDGKTVVAAGVKSTYTITVKNVGPDTVYGPVVTDNFPSTFTAVTYTATASGGATGFTATGTGNINDSVNMAPGSKIIYHATGKLSSSATDAMSNTATVSIPGGVTDPNPSNNSATDTDTIFLKSDLKVTVNDGKTTAVAGTKDTYTITILNIGPSDVSGASLTDTFPSTFTGVTYTATATLGATGFTTSGTGNISDTALKLPAKAKITYKAKGTIDPSATGSISNTATASVPSGVTDPNTANNTATDTDSF
jgi:uncharacterized repeat protein (TIGR01451 family)